MSSSATPASIEDFDKKLNETDAYLSLLVAQTAQLKTKLESAATEEAKARYEKVLREAQEMAESVKHAIVVLQIAKNTAAPQETAAVKDLTQLHHQQQQQQQQEQQQKQQNPVGIPEAGKVVNVTEDKPPQVAGATLVRPDKTSAIPEISYSSSDDDDFYDAKDEDEDDETSDEEEVKTVAEAVVVGGLDLNLDDSACDVSGAQSPLTPRSDMEIDYDSLYSSADADDDDVDMKSHGSVITHLLSQVRIGMDLTKIVLPTFILERRSLLEMYSDFFAHPDLFIGIPDGKTPEDRMVRVLRWYLSSFHAGRKSSIAKKPYNPIIGETFRCHWTGLDSSSSSSSSSSKNSSPVSDGPVPWATENDLTFVAEQVSHHPPISGFYAEHPAKRISVNAHIYTKSSFLGVSVIITVPHLHVLDNFLHQSV